MRLEKDLLTSLNVPNGRSLRIDCPNCGGSLSVSISNDCGTLKYKCFKASCNTRGIYEGGISTSLLEASFKSKERGLVEYTPFSVPPYFKPECGMVDKYRTYPTFLDIKENRRVFLVYKDLVVIDAVGRALTKNVKPKWKRYARSNYPFIANLGASSRVKAGVGVIVEDVISAVAVSDTVKYVGVALMGTNLHSGSSKWLDKFSSLVVALDNDASSKAADMVKYLNWFVPTRQVLLDKDLKMYSTREVGGILE